MLLTVIICSLLPYKIPETFWDLHHSSTSSFIPSCSPTPLLFCFLWEVLIPDKYFIPSTLSQWLLQSRHQQHFRFLETWEISHVESRLFPSLWVTVLGKSTILYQDSCRGPFRLVILAAAQFRRREYTQTEIGGETRSIQTEIFPASPPNFLAYLKLFC